MPHPLNSSPRHREAASAAVAIQHRLKNLELDCFASLAMTALVAWKHLTWPGIFAL
jgi:hypothetical protein